MIAPRGYPVHALLPYRRSPRSSVSPNAGATVDRRNRKPRTATPMRGHRVGAAVQLPPGAGRVLARTCATHAIGKAPVAGLAGPPITSRDTRRVHGADGRRPAPWPARRLSTKPGSSRSAAIPKLSGRLRSDRICGSRRRTHRREEFLAGSRGNPTNIGTKGFIGGSHRWLHATCAATTTTRHLP